MSISCSALSALCENVFKCNSCTSSCAPNCTKSITVIVVDPQHQNSGILSLLERGQTFQQILDTAHQQREQVSTGIRKERIHHLSQKTPHQMKVFQAAILDVTFQFFQKTNNLSIPHGETWAKFRASCAISEVNLEKKYDSGEALTSKEYTQLQKGINKVSKFWDLAFYLWIVTLNHNLDWDLLKIESAEKIELITKKQVKFLKNQLHFVEKKRISNKRSFSGLDLNLLIIFLRASFMFSTNIQKASHLQSTLARHAAHIAQRREGPQPAATAYSRGYEGTYPRSAYMIHTPSHDQWRMVEMDSLRDPSSATADPGNYPVQTWSARAMSARSADSPERLRDLEQRMQKALKTKWTSVVKESPSAPMPASPELERMLSTIAESSTRPVESAFTAIEFKSDDPAREMFHSS